MENTKCEGSVHIAEFVENCQAKFATEQEEAISKILTNIQNMQGGIFFLDAPRGTGKPFYLTSHC